MSPQEEMVEAASTVEAGRAADRARLAELDKAHVLHAHQVVGEPAEPLIVARGRGARIWDVEGREFIDGTCGLQQCAVGHGRPELADVAARQLAELEFYPSFWDFSNPPAIRLAERLTELAPEGLEAVHFTSGGSEANETAIKLARLAWAAAGQEERHLVLSRQGAYHGQAGLSGAAGGLPGLKERVGPLGPGFVHLATPHARLHGENATELLIDELERTIEELGPERIAAFIGEPVLGVGGMVPPPDGYWPAVEEVLRRHGILLILDEVITGFGRVGEWFAAERYGVAPDLMVTAKGLTSGYFPMGGVLVGRRALELLDGTEFRHGFTYSGHPTAAAVALENLAIIEREGLAARATELGAHALGRLSELEALDLVAEVRGVGLMIGVELVDGAPAVAAAVRDRGVITRATGQTLVVCPPLVIERDELDLAVDAIAAEIRALAGTR